MAISVQYSVHRGDRELVGDIFDCGSIEDAVAALREAADHLETESLSPPIEGRQKHDDDGVEYADPRDARDERMR